MKLALSTILSVPLLLPFFGGHHTLTRADVQHALAKQMNGGRTAPITKRVDCSPSGGVDRYFCTLTGVGGGKGHAIVVVSGSSWRAEWAPPNG